MLDRSSLRRLLLLARHQAYLLEHAHEIVKKILFHDLTLFVPSRNGTEIHVETLSGPALLWPVPTPVGE